MASVQNLYNFTDRGHDDVLDHCTEHGIVFIPWLPVGGGRPADPALVRVAGDLGATPTQVALAWLLHRSPVMLPIPGTRSPQHLAENVAAAGLTLDGRV